MHWRRQGTGACGAGAGTASASALAATRGGCPTCRNASMLLSCAIAVPTSSLALLMASTQHSISVGSPFRRRMRSGKRACEASTFHQGGLACGQRQDNRSERWRRDMLHALRQASTHLQLVRLDAAAVLQLRDGKNFHLARPILDFLRRLGIRQRLVRQLEPPFLVLGALQCKREAMVSKSTLRSSAKRLMGAALTSSFVLDSFFFFIK